MRLLCGACFKVGVQTRRPHVDSTEWKMWVLCHLSLRVSWADHGMHSSNTVFRCVEEGVSGWSERLIGHSLKHPLLPVLVSIIQHTEGLERTKEEGGVHPPARSPELGHPGSSSPALRAGPASATQLTLRLWTWTELFCKISLPSTWFSAFISRLSQSLKINMKLYFWVYKHRYMYHTHTNTSYLFCFSGESQYRGEHEGLFYNVITYICFIPTFYYFIFIFIYFFKHTVQLCIPNWPKTQNFPHLLVTFATHSAPLDSFGNKTPWAAWEPISKTGCKRKKILGLNSASVKYTEEHKNSNNRVNPKPFKNAIKVIVLFPYLHIFLQYSCKPFDIRNLDTTNFHIVLDLSMIYSNHVLIVIEILKMKEKQLRLYQGTVGVQ